MQKRDLNKAALQHYLHTDTPPKIRSTPVEHSSSGEHLCGTAFVCQKNFKRLKL